MKSAFNNIIFRIDKWSTDSKVIVKNVFWAFFIKGLSLIVSFFSVPAFISYFNDNTYLGVWYTMLSILMWFLTFDFGIGNGIRNSLVKALASKSWLDAKSIISSGLVAIFIVTFGMAIIGLLLLKIIDLNKLFNVNSNEIATQELTYSVIIVFMAILMRFILVNISSIFYALQKSSVNNFLALISSIFILIYVLIFRFHSPGLALINLSWAYFISYSIPPIIAGIWVFITDLKICKPTFKSITRYHFNKIIHIGGIFFYCQILYTLITCTDQILITYLFSPSSTVDYTFYYRLTSLVGMVVMLAITPIWSMVTKAFEEKKYIWLNNLYQRLKKIGYGIIILEFLFIPFLQPIMNIWLGNESIEVNYFTAISFALFNGTFVMGSIVSSIVCGLERMKLQALVYSVGVILKILLVILLYRMINNWVIVIWGNIIVFSAYSIAQIIDLNIFFRKLKTTNTY